MKPWTASLMALVAATAFAAQGTQDQIRAGAALSRVSPALEAYTRNALFGDLWKRPGLSRRDRCLVTLATLITRNQTAELAFYLDLALEEGVKPQEISEIITHLAFYSGWGNAMAAVNVAEPVFVRRRITAAQLPPAAGPHLPVDATAEATRVVNTQRAIGPEFPGLLHFTNDLLFQDLWLRPALAPRDRSLITISSLVASGQLGPFSNHLNRAMDFGLTETQATEAITHLAFYAGWPHAVSALPIAKDVFGRRPH
ncbi:MAG: carboxymuconolactone decarboxylase family protein [Acidobacteria bacterium]|nr:carboxymuconolactone decarboxylase family protein [Acidobacteriota bacterium]MBI3489479.1 carboxymuconolactone decarboxylase family protein [Acidobacteriota bacterium]